MIHRYKIPIKQCTICDVNSSDQGSKDAIPGDPSESYQSFTTKQSELLTAAMTFEAEHEECLRVLPYTESGQVVVKLYMFSGALGIPENVKEAAQRCFGDMEVELEWLDLYNNATNILKVTPVEYPFGEPKILVASQVDEINEVISKNLHAFEHRNITSLQASFKVTKSKQTEEPCVTIYVLGKGSIPIGESEFPLTLGPYPVDVVDGFWCRTHDPKRPTEAQQQKDVLRLGASIGVNGEDASGTLGAIVKEENSNTLYALSCDHVMKHSEKSEIIHPGLNDHLEYLRYYLNEYRKEVSKIAQPDCQKVRFSVETLQKSEMSEKFQELKTVKQMHCDSEDLDEATLGAIKEHERAFEAGLKPPRIVGNYIAGVRCNVKWSDKKEYFIDGAIAELTADETKTLIKSRTARIIGTGDYPSGECSPTTTHAIVNAGELRKSGRTTGYTTSGSNFRVDPPHFMKPPLFQIQGALVDVGKHNYFCQECAAIQGSHSQLEKSQELVFQCKGCKKPRGNLYESLWLKNCLCISNTGQFSAKGDSGAVIFEKRDDNHSDSLPGFGIIFAQHINAYKCYAIASPLQVALEVLSQEISTEDQACNLRLVSKY